MSASRAKRDSSMLENYDSNLAFSVVYVVGALFYLRKRLYHYKARSLNNAHDIEHAYSSSTSS